VEELRALTDFAHAQGLYVHMDGARLFNAAASLDVPLRAITSEVGIDALSLGGTKNGLLFGEAVVLFNGLGKQDFKYQRKQAMQLCSKSRFVAAQFLALLEDELWLRNARHVNAMAQRLAAGARQVPPVQLTHPVQANAVFAILPAAMRKRLVEEFFFYVWDEHTGEVRWMCTWDTTAEDVDSFVAACARAAVA
jgi:threonine aldolase